MVGQRTPTAVGRPATAVHRSGQDARGGLTFTVPVTTPGPSGVTPAASDTPASTATTAVSATATTTVTDTPPPGTSTAVSATASVTSSATAPTLPLDSATAPALPIVAATPPLTPGADTPVTSTVATLNAAAGVTATQAAYGRLPLSFEPNVGQAGPDGAAVQFLSHGSGYNLFLTGTDATLTLRQPRPRPQFAHGHTHDLLGTDALTQTTPISESVVRLRYAGANPSPQVVGEDQLPGKVNYFIGNDPSQYHTDIPTYARVAYKSVYPGVDLVYYGTQGQLEYDWQVAPGADPGAIAFGVDGPQNAHIDAQGNLLLQTGSGVLEQRAPVVYQEVDGRRHPVSAGYTLTGNTVSFSIGAYDTSKPLVIDPVLGYSTYLGGSGNDQGMSIAVDGAANIYVTGFTTSSDFPLSNAISGTYQGNGNNEAFVTKFKGDVLLYSTYLGGSSGDNGNHIAIDSAGDAYVTGSTNSSDFPTVNAVQRTFGGVSDAFVTKLSPSGNALLYSTYLGGSGEDTAYGIALDGSGDAYITGYTKSTNFPLANARQGAFGAGTTHAFVTKLNATGSALMYSTYLGGSGDDIANGIAVDSSGAAYVTGQTSSSNFPTLNAVQAANGGGNDAFVTKLNPTGSALVYSTYLGGTNADASQGIAVDTVGDAYVAGWTRSTNFPTVNAEQASYGGTGRFGFGHGFVTKLNPSGSAWVYSTYLGGSGDDNCYGITVDGMGNAYVTGETDSTDFPTVNPVQSVYGGDVGDAFLTKLNATGNALLYSTYLGGTAEDEGGGVTLDGAGNAYVIGYTYSANFPTLNPGQGPGGGEDAFITEVLAGSSGTIPWRPHQSVRFGDRLERHSSNRAGAWQGVPRRRRMERDR